jgi:hypothetical protein
VIVSRLCKTSIHSITGNNVAGTGKKNQRSGKAGDKSKKSPKPVEDNDVEDGDIATPKRDRDGEDDEPL